MLDIFIYVTIALIAMLILVAFYFTFKDDE